MNLIESMQSLRARLQAIEEGLVEFVHSDSEDGPGEDPYKRPKPKHYARSIDYFGQFEADHFDHEKVNDAEGTFKGYWGSDQIAGFKFDDPSKTGSDDPGTGWYYEPMNERVSLGNPDGSYPADAHTPEKQQELNQWVSQKITVDVNQPGELKRGEMTRPTDSGFETLPVIAYSKTGLRPRFPMGTEQTKGQLLGHGIVDVKIYNGTAYIELP